MTATTYRGVIRRGKVEIMDNIELPDGAEVYIVASVSVAVSTAKRNANRWLVSEVGNLLMADHGALVRSNAGWVWQFEVLVQRLVANPGGHLG